MAGWFCWCDCGGTKIANEYLLTRNMQRDCGCISRTKHRTTVLNMLRGAMSRAAKNGVPFDINEGDIVLPKRCPLLDIPLKPNSGSFRANSPTLDRIIPRLGYVRGNIWVISHRANTIKNNATLEEFSTIQRNWTRTMQAKRRRALRKPETI
jgi:hypothetical protein